MKSLKINKPKILLVGAGNFGRHHLVDLLKLEKKGNIEFIGAISNNPERQTYIKSLGANVFSKLTDELLQSVDAVDIVTPPSTHADIVKQCLPYVAVFLEKPITLDVKQGLELDNLAKKYNQVLFLGHIYRFHPAVLKLKELILDSDTKPDFIECIFEDKPKQAPKDCGILYSDLHGFDIIDYLFNEEPIKISATGKKVRPDSKFEDEVMVCLGYKSGLEAKVNLSWNILPKKRSINVQFSDKNIYVDLMSQEISIINNGKAKVLKIIGDTPLFAELDNFVEVLNGKQKNYPDARLGTRIVNIAAHAEKSLHAGMEIKYMRADINFIHSEMIE